jgi:hypothetical protein
MPAFSPGLRQANPFADVAQIPRSGLRVTRPASDLVGFRQRKPGTDAAAVNSQIWISPSEGLCA